MWVRGIDPDESDDYFMTMTDFLTPTSLYLGTVGQPERELLKSLPAFFDTEGLGIQQFEATSQRRHPRSLFSGEPQRGQARRGEIPRFYMGMEVFEISLQPYYSAGVGSAWLERGGVYVLANIRGGGEFGPDWHNAARKEKTGSVRMMILLRLRKT